MRYQLIGLGDLVAALLDKVGIHPWPGCGCAARQKFLNQLQVAILVQEEDT